MARADYGSAIKAFLESDRKYQSKLVWFRPGLLQAYEAMGNFEEAIDQFKRYIEMYPTSSEP